MLESETRRGPSFSGATQPCNGIAQHHDADHGEGGETSFTATCL